MGHGLGREDTRVTWETLEDLLEPHQDLFTYMYMWPSIIFFFFFIVGRLDATLDDLGLAFRDLGINLSELEDYVKHVDPLPFAHEVVAFPAPKENNLHFPKPNSREVVQRLEDEDFEHIHEHLPPMYPEQEGNNLVLTKYWLNVIFHFVNFC